MERDIEAERRALNRDYVAGKITESELAQAVHELKRDSPDDDLDALVGFDYLDPEMPLFADHIPYDAAVHARELLEAQDRVNVGRIEKLRRTMRGCPAPVARPSRDGQIAEMYRNGMGRKEIQDRLGITRNEVRHAIDRQRSKEAQTK